jgi:hypothetical protein
LEKSTSYEVSKYGVKINTKFPTFLLNSPRFLDVEEHQLLGWEELSGQFHDLAALPPEKSLRYLLN